VSLALQVGELTAPLRAIFGGGLARDEHAAAASAGHTAAAVRKPTSGYRLVRGPLLQPAGEGALQAIGEAVVHVQQSLERPSAGDLIARLPGFVSDLTVLIRRSTDRPAVAGGHTMSPTETMGVD